MTTRTISFRADDETQAALDELTTVDGTLTEAIRHAILAHARQRRQERMRQEALAVANDPEDLAEARAIQADMESLRAW